MTEKIIEMRRQMGDGSTLVLVPHKAESAVKDGQGQTITLTYATKNEVQQVGTTIDTIRRTMVTTDTEQTITGEKTVSSILAPNTKLHSKIALANVAGKWKRVCSFGYQGSRNHIFEIVSAAGDYPCYGILHTENDYAGFPRVYWVLRKWNNNSSDLRDVGCVAIVKGIEANKVQLWVKGTHTLSVRVMDAYVGTDNLNDVEMHTVLQEVDDLDTLGGQVYYATDYPDGKYFSSTPVAGDSSLVVVNKAYVESTDGVTNNLVHTIGTEFVDGEKTFGKAITIDGPSGASFNKVRSDVHGPPSVGSKYFDLMNCYDADGNNLCRFYVRFLSTGVVTLNAEIRNSNGTAKTVILASGDTI